MPTRRLANACDTHGLDPLHCAVFRGATDALKALGNHDALQDSPFTMLSIGELSFNAGCMPLHASLVHLAAMRGDTARA